LEAIAIKDRLGARASGVLNNNLCGDGCGRLAAEAGEHGQGLEGAEGRERGEISFHLVQLFNDNKQQQQRRLLSDRLGIKHKKSILAPAKKVEFAQAARRY
jgi:hypothetical protein